MAEPPEPVLELQPVHEDPDEKPREKLGLCLSGGGYRAMLFHLGALWRLNQLKMLRELNRVSSVSGGSITAATLGLHWRDLDWRDGVATNLESLVVDRVRGLAGETIDVWSVLEGFLPFTSVGKRVADAYREHLFGSNTLQALPAGDGDPRFVICATNLESGVLFRFSQPYIADYRVGRIERPDIQLADAVAASSAFPPILSPFELRLDPNTFTPGSGKDLQRVPFTSKVILSDGGVYDNLGLETVWKRCQTVLISDGGGHLPDDPDPPDDWPRQSIRVLQVIDRQVRALRSRQAVGSFKLGLRQGTYWGIRSRVADYRLGDALEADPRLTDLLADTPTRLKKLNGVHQERLINWGYVICDTAVRRWVTEGGPPPGGLPYPEAGLG
jgi:NTE family protein